MRLEQSKDHPIQKYLETSSNLCILVQFKARPEQRTAILPITVTCNRSLRHTARHLHRESGKHEEGGTLPQGFLNAKIATCCSQSEFAQWLTRSTRTRRKNILWPSKRIAGLREKPGATTLTTEYPAYPFVQSNSRTQLAKTKSKGWFSSSRGTRTKNLSCKTWTRRRWSICSAKSRRSWSPTWTTLRSSNFAKHLPKSNAPIAIPTEKSALCIAVVEEIWRIFAETKRVRKEQLRRLINSWLCYQKE